jgi:hypothetical protein
VDVQVSKRPEDDYLLPPAKPFSGTENRLGAPTSAPSDSVARAASPPAPASSASINPRFEVDTTQPTSIQVRLADGTTCGLSCSSGVEASSSLRGFRSELLFWLLVSGFALRGISALGLRVLHLLLHPFVPRSLTCFYTSIIILSSHSMPSSRF